MKNLILLSIVFIGMAAAQAQAQGERTVMKKNASQAEGTSQMNLGQQQRRVAPMPYLWFEPVAGVLQNSWDGVQGINGISLKGRTGFSAGMNILVGQGATQFESGLLYAERGAKIEGTHTSGFTLNMEFTTKYIEVPLLVRYTFYKNRSVRFFGKAGAIAAFLTDAVGSGSVSGPTIKNFSGSGNAKSAYQDFDGRLAGALGMGLPLSRTVAITGTIDYQLGLAKINKSSGDEAVYNNSFGGMLGLTIGI